MSSLRPFCAWKTGLCSVRKSYLYSSSPRLFTASFVGIITLRAYACFPVGFVPLSFQLVCKLRSAGANDSAVDHDVDEVGLDVVQQALIVRDQQDRHLAVLAVQSVHTVRDDLERIDVEA